MRVLDADGRAGSDAKAVQELQRRHPANGGGELVGGRLQDSAAMGMGIMPSASGSAQSRRSDVPCYAWRYGPRDYGARA